jgi:hypothetical protein
MLGKRMARLLLMQHHSSHHPFIIHHTTQQKRFLADIKQLNTSIISLGLDLAFFMQFFPQNTGSTSASSYVEFKFLYKDTLQVPSYEKHTHNLFNLLRNLRICIISGELIAFISAAQAFTFSFMLLQRLCG